MKNLKIKLKFYLDNGFGVWYNEYKKINRKEGIGKWVKRICAGLAVNVWRQDVPSTKVQKYMSETNMIMMESVWIVSSTQSIRKAGYIQPAHISSRAVKDIVRKQTLCVATIV